MSLEIPASHPRAKSLEIREKLIEACQERVVAFAGLIAHGRGEAFDYLIGEATPPPARAAVRAAVAALLLARHPVLSVNGNVAALCPQAMVQLAQLTGAQLEINLFYRTAEREQAIRRVLEEAGAKRILGLDAERLVQIPELQSERRIVDIEGIHRADVVLVPLEDGDRTEALVRLGKRVITIDLNPLSRTARRAQITIVDEVTRAVQLMLQQAAALAAQPAAQLETQLGAFDNGRNLADSLQFISQRLQTLSAQLAAGAVEVENPGL